MAEAPFDAAGPTLTDAAAGWTLTLPGVGALPVGAGWHEIVCEKQAEPAAGAPEGAAPRDPACFSNAGADRLALATRGEQRPDGSVLVHVVDTTSPHRVIVRRDADGRIAAGWHIPPLGGGWEALYVPASVIGG